MLIIGLLIGAASGILQFWMLAKFTKAVTGGALDKKSALLGAGQFLLPLAVLLGCAFLLNDSLLWAAVGMVVALIVCAVAKYIMGRILE